MSPGSEPESSRRARALDGARREGADALLVTGRANVRYCSGFSGSSGWLLLGGARDACLITDGRYTDQATVEAPGCRVVIAERGLARALAEELGTVRRVGFESAQLTYAAFEELRERAADAEWLPTQGIVEGLRARKSEAEVERIRRSLALAEQVLVDVVSSAGSVTEAGLAARLDHECRARGAAGMAFETIVAGGAHGARPHARPRSEALPEGVPVVVDMGCIVDGYCSDITRCVTAGPIDPEWEPIVAAVSEARAAGIAAIRAGVEAKEVDAAARAVLAEHGLAESFVHSLGHGVGIEVHERPRLAARSADTLEAGMVVTVEPGVYLPGRGGVRLEDMVLVTEDGSVRLNRLSDAPIRLCGGA